MSVPPRLVAITDTAVLAPAPLLERVRSLADAAAPGSLAVLLRDHALSARARLALGQALKPLLQPAGHELWVADRIDLALLLAADALHLGEASVSALAARRLLGPGVRISRAWHASEPGAPAAAAAELEGVDALLVSPVMAERKGRRALGLATFGALGSQLRARNQAYPLYALGGITAENAAACLQAGATGVAAIGAALNGGVRALLGALGALR